MSKGQSREAWDRAAEETDKAWEAFVIYRDMGTSRSIAKVSDKLGKSTPLIQRWATMWKWQARTRLYDNHLDQVARAAHVDEIVKMRRRHTKMAMAMQGLGAAAMQQYKKVSKSGKVSVTLSARDATRMMKEGVGIERQARGEPDQVIENRETDVVSALEREVQRILDDPTARRELDRAGSSHRLDTSDARLLGGGVERGAVEEDEAPPAGE